MVIITLCPTARYNQINRFLKPINIPNGVLVTYKEDWDYDIYREIDGAGDNCGNWNKSDEGMFRRSHTKMCTQMFVAALATATPPTIYPYLPVSLSLTLSNPPPLPILVNINFQLDTVYSQLRGRPQFEEFPRSGWPAGTPVKPVLTDAGGSSHPFPWQEVLGCVRTHQRTSQQAAFSHDPCLEFLPWILSNSGLCEPEMKAKQTFASPRNFC